MRSSAARRIWVLPATGFLAAVVACSSSHGDEDTLHTAAAALNGVCASPADCDDGNACTADTCNQDGSCSHSLVSCDDNNACTADSCDALNGCLHTLVSCDDGNACTADSCDALNGCLHTLVSCDDGNACTADSCDALNGCLHTLVSCDDNNACTADSCDALNGCLHTLVSCDDGNACTVDSCDSASGCLHSLVDCDDKNSCTLDSCDPQGGCAHVNHCPDCTSAAATLASLWPPNHKMVTVGVKGVTDPQGQSTTITVLAVDQDEPTNDVGDGNTCPDASPVGGSTVQLRAERQGTGDGRVYHVLYRATDPDGFSCMGEVTACVPLDQGRDAVCIDEGAKFDSSTCP
jgi:hypothetical protein